METFEQYRKELNNFIKLKAFNYANGDEYFIEELTQIADIAIYNGLNSYKKDSKASVKSYLMLNIEWEMKDYLTNNIKQIRLPANLAVKKDIDFRQPISSDIIVDEDDGTTLVQKIPDEVTQEIDYSHLSKTINTLTKKEQEIIRLRFIQNMTLQEIGDELDLTKEAIRVNLNKILKKLKDKIDLKQIY